MYKILHIVLELLICLFIVIGGSFPVIIFCNTLILRVKNQAYHKSWDEPMIHSLVALIYNKV